MRLSTLPALTLLASFYGHCVLADTAGPPGWEEFESVSRAEIVDFLNNWVPHACFIPAHRSPAGLSKGHCFFEVDLESGFLRYTEYNFLDTEWDNHRHSFYLSDMNPAEVHEYFQGGALNYTVRIICTNNAYCSNDVYFYNEKGKWQDWDSRLKLYWVDFTVSSEDLSERLANALRAAIISYGGKQDKF